jgi:hypothetical protein
VELNVRNRIFIIIIIIIIIIRQIAVRTAEELYFGIGVGRGAKKNTSTKYRRPRNRL